MGIGFQCQLRNGITQVMKLTKNQIVRWVMKLDIIWIFLTIHAPSVEQKFQKR